MRDIPNRLLHIFKKAHDENSTPKKWYIPVMTRVNRYANRSKISEAQFRALVRLFALDIEATKIAAITGLHRNTINRYLRGIREHIAAFYETELPFAGEVEIDESYFGTKRIRGKRGRGTCGKTIVFGIFQHERLYLYGDRPQCPATHTPARYSGPRGLETVIHSDGWRGYNGLVDMGYQKHLRVQHGIDEFVSSTSHINGIEAFWSVAKTRLAKFWGMARSTFYLHLEECEFRFNYRHENLYHWILKICRNNPLF